MPWRKGNRLKRLSEAEAQGRVKEIYGETKQVLGLPCVDFVFQAFGLYPRFLDLHWRALKPIVESQQFFDLAERLRADAYTRANSYFRLSDLCAGINQLKLAPDARQELTRVIDLCHYGRALLLLTMAAQYQAFESSVGQDGVPHAPASHPAFAEPPVLVDEQTAPLSTRRIFDELKRNLDLPFVPGEYRAFARWPDFLKLYWQALKSIAQSPVYEGCQHALRETAFTLTWEFPRPVQLTIPDLSEAGINDSDLTSIVRITELLVRSLSASVLNIAIATIGMETTKKAPARVAESGKEKEEAA